MRALEIELVFYYYTIIVNLQKSQVEFSIII